MKQKDYPPQKIKQVLEKVEGLYESAKKLEYGQLLVVGVPSDKMSKWVYGCRRFGIATGCSMTKVMDDLSKGLIPKAGQVRVTLTEESLDPINGVQVVNLMDDKAVEDFCEGIPMKPLSEEEGLQKVHSHERSSAKHFDRQPLEVFQEIVKKTIQEVLK